MHIEIEDKERSNLCANISKNLNELQINHSLFKSKFEEFESDYLQLKSESTPKVEFTNFANNINQTIKISK